MKLAFIGLGAIGKPMSERLIDNGYDLNLYKSDKLKNDDQKRYFVDPIEAVTDCDGLLICVTDDIAVESVLFGDNGVADSLKPKSFVIDFSTISPNKSISIHKRLSKKISFMLTVQFQGGQRGLIKVHCLCLLVQAKKSVYLLNIYLKSLANQLITLMA